VTNTTVEGVARERPRVFRKASRDAVRTERAVFSFVIAAHPMLCLLGGAALAGLLLSFGVGSVYET
jgi:hypothetical protein